MLRFVKGKLVLPVALMVAFALSRVPGMLPQNFSAAYALAFCAGVYVSGRLAWWLRFRVPTLQFDAPKAPRAPIST